MVTSTGTWTGLFSSLALLTGFLMAGCSSLQTGPATPLDQQMNDPAVTDPMVVVELRDGDNRREYLRAPLKENMVVQDALKGSGAMRRFRRMNVVLVREVPGSQKLRLPVQYDASKRRVVDANNYAMHGGDWLEVTEDTRTTFDRMIESAMQPLRPILRGYRE